MSASPHARLEEALAHASIAGVSRWGVHVPDADVRLLLREFGDVAAGLADARLRLAAVANELERNETKGRVVVDLLDQLATITARLRVVTEERDAARDALAGLIEGGAL